MIIDTTQTKVEKQLEDFHPDCCGCAECAYEFYNPVYPIVRKTISGFVCSCGSVDFGVIAYGYGYIEHNNGSSFICKQCNRWEYLK